MRWDGVWNIRGEVEYLSLEGLFFLGYKLGCGKVWNFWKFGCKVYFFYYGLGYEVFVKKILRKLKWLVWEVWNFLVY